TGSVARFSGKSIMILQLYRVEHQGRASYAVLREDRFYFVDLKNPDAPVSPDRSASTTECRITTPTVPTKIICIGLNYRDHAEEQKKPPPKAPPLSLTPPRPLLARDHPTAPPPVSERVDPEGKLAVIIGAAASKLPSPEGASRYIFGYSCFND